MATKSFVVSGGTLVADDIRPNHIIVREDGIVEIDFDYLSKGVAIASDARRHKMGDLPLLLEEAFRNNIEQDRLTDDEYNVLIKGLSVNDSSAIALLPGPKQAGVSANIDSATKIWNALQAAVSDAWALVRVMTLTEP